MTLKAEYEFKVIYSQLIINVINIFIYSLWVYFLFWFSLYCSTHPRSNIEISKAIYQLPKLRLLSWDSYVSVKNCTNKFIILLITWLVPADLQAECFFDLQLSHTVNSSSHTPEIGQNKTLYQLVMKQQHEHSAFLTIN